MDRIEDYIHSLSKRVQLEPKELEEFKNEIRSHLRDSAQALRQEGHSEEESLTLALQRFGEEESINAELRSLYRFRKGFKKSMLAASVLFLAASFLLILYAQFLERRNASDFDDMLHRFHGGLEARIADGSVTHSEIESYFKENKRILRFVSLSRSDSNEDPATTDYTYPEITGKDELNTQPIVPFPIPGEDREGRREF